MPALDQNTAYNQLQGLTGQAAYTATVTPLNLRLMMSAPTASVTGTELPNGGGYTTGGKNITFGAFTLTLTGATCSNTGAITWTNGGSSAWTIVGLEIWDSSGTPVRKAYGLWDNQPVIIGPGSQFPVAANALNWVIPLYLNCVPQLRSPALYPPARCRDGGALPVGRLYGPDWPEVWHYRSGGQVGSPSPGRNHTAAQWQAKVVAGNL